MFPKCNKINVFSPEFCFRLFWPLGGSCWRTEVVPCFAWSKLLTGRGCCSRPRAGRPSWRSSSWCGPKADVVGLEKTAIKTKFVLFTVYKEQNLKLQTSGVLCTSLLQPVIFNKKSKFGEPTYFGPFFFISALKFKIYQSTCFRIKVQITFSKTWVSIKGQTF